MIRARNHHDGLTVEASPVQYGGEQHTIISLTMHHDGARDAGRSIVRLDPPNRPVANPASGARRMGYPASAICLATLAATDAPKERPTRQSSERRYLDSIWSPDPGHFKNRRRLVRPRLLDSAESCFLTR